MSFNINKQLNAEEQEPIAANADATATTNEPVEAQTETLTAPAPEPRIETAHDDFDWSRDKRNVAAYSADETTLHLSTATFCEVTNFSCL